MASDIEKRSKKWAWLNVIGLGFLCSGGIQTILACSGNFVVPIVTELGFDVSSLMFWITCYAFGMAFSQLFVGKLWLIVKTPILLTVSYVISIAALAMMGTYTEIWQWYASGVVIGLSGGVYFMVGAPIVITNWFAKNSGFALGFTTVIGAIGAAIISPVEATIIGALGWRMAYPVMAIISCVYVLPWTIFVIRFKPEDRGCKPVGWEEGMDNNVAGEEDAHGMSVRKGVFSLAFVFLFLGASVGALFGGYQNLWPSAGAAEWGYDATYGSLMVSATALFGLLAPLFGLLIDKLGCFKACYIIMLGPIISSIMLIFFHGNPIICMIFVFLFSDQMTVVGNLVPLAVRDVFGAKNYTKILSYIQIGIGLIGGFSAPLVSGVWQAFGTFNASLILSICMAIFVIVMFVLVQILKKRMVWDE